MSLNSYRSYVYVLIMTLNANFGALLFGYLMSVYSPLQDFFAVLYDWSSSEKDSNNGIITAIMPIGAVIGALFIGSVSQKFGRKNCLLIGDVLGLIGIGVTMIQSLPALLAGRFLAGASVGISSVIVPIYVNEMSPEEVSGQMGTWFQTNINVGILIGYLWGFGVPKVLGEKDYYWRIMFAFPAIFCLLRLAFLILFFNFDTPDCLIRQNNDSDAQDVIQKIYNDEYCSPTFNKKKDDFLKARSTTYGQLLSQRYIKRLFVGVMLSVLQQLSGANAVIFYSNSIFKEIFKDSDIIPNVLSVVISVILTISAFSSGFIIDKNGRRTVFLAGSFAIFVNLFILGFTSKYGVDAATIAFTFIYMFSFGSSMGPIVWLYMPEILPEKGVSLASLTNWVFTAIIGYTFPLMESSDGFHIQGTFWFYSGCMVFAFAFIFFMVKETKGKTAREVESMFGYEAILSEDSGEN
jgi:MFS transporter, SP family, arabinose:H+ symporter